SPAPGQSPEASVKLGLKNAHGAMLWSVVLQDVFNAEPAIALLLFVHWGNACNAFWQKVGDERRRVLSWRGGGAVSQPMQLAFLFHAARMVRGVFAAHRPATPGDALAATGIAEDWYLAGAASSIVQLWPRLRSVTAAGGRALTDSKCGCWPPGLDGGVGEPDSATALLGETTRRSRGGMHVLGTALRKDNALDIDAEQCGVGPAEGRAARAARLCERLRAFVGSCTHDDTQQFRVQVLGRFHDEIASAAAAILGTTLSAAMTERLALPVFFGGFALNVPRVDDGAAGSWSSWIATACGAQRVASLAGLPFQAGPDRPAALEAKDVLAASGVVVDAGQIELEPRAAAGYAASPLRGDVPVQGLFTFAHGAEDARVHALDPGRSLLAASAPGADVGDVERGGGRRQLAGRLGRGPAALRAADLAAALPQERAANLACWTAAAEEQAFGGQRRQLPRQRGLATAVGCQLREGAWGHLPWSPARASAIVEVESHIPELYQTGRDGGVKEAILDVCWRWPAGPTRTWLDVTVHSYPDGETRAAAADVRLATRAAERAKRKRYGDRVAAFAVSIGGRLEEDALAIPRQIDVDAANHTWVSRGLQAPPPGLAMLAAISAAVVSAEAEANLFAIAPLPPQ
ncbi:unnamed protein product, partial [Prorocentrum cordatum]